MVLLEACPCVEVLVGVDVVGGTTGYVLTSMRPAGFSAIGGTRQLQLSLEEQGRRARVGRAPARRDTSRVDARVPGTQGALRGGPGRAD